jgi:hypothetical protein
MFGMNISIWGVLQSLKLFLVMGQSKRLIAKQPPSPSLTKQKDLKGTPTNQYGSHSHIIFSGLMVIN